MKQIASSKRIMRFFPMIAMCAGLFSFTSFGGESYTIYVNDKQVVQQFVRNLAATPSITLDQSSASDRLKVYYSLCGKIGQGRSLSVRDESDKILKEWKFEDSSGEHSPMTFTSKEIFALPRGNSTTLGVVYSSNLLPRGKLLANLVLAGSVNN